MTEKAGAAVGPPVFGVAVVVFLGVVLAVVADLVVVVVVANDIVVEVGLTVAWSTWRGSNVERGRRRRKSREGR